MWVDLTVDSEVWAGYGFRLNFDADGELLGIEVGRSGNAADLTAHLLQRVPLGALERKARHHIREILDPFVELLGPESTARRQIVDVISKERPRRSDANERAGMLALLAIFYVETLGRRDQTQMLAERFHYNEATIPKLISTARNEYGFLPPTKRGRPGGSVTPKAYAVAAAYVNTRHLEGLSPDERERHRAEQSASGAQWQEMLSRYQNGEITHAEWEMATFGQTFPRDEAGNIHLNDEEG